ncbi:GDP-mannose 4,6-dehydratase, partial [Pseudomonas syringae]|uniref:GDP-mannose 4,6-dehydratase n=1 Tax=Pseudomonas syringae TaxID=317 RepID=UPI001CAA017E
MNKSFWEHKKVLITGDTGFKGAWLAFLLNQLGAEVQGFSSSEFNNNIKLYNSLKLESMNNTIDADIRDSSTLEKVF